MARKHDVNTRTQVEVALACDVPTKVIAMTTGVSRSTQQNWVKAGAAKRGQMHSRNWRQKNPDAVSAMNRRYREKNLERLREYARARNKIAYALNPEYYIEKSATRRRNSLKVPLTLDERRQIQALIRKARLLSQSTGVPHEVDHIWPIARGGWHHPANMRVITREENRRKRDKLPSLEEMLRNTNLEEIP